MDGVIYNDNSMSYGNTQIASVSRKSRVKANIKGAADSWRWRWLRTLNMDPGAVAALAAYAGAAYGPIREAAMP